MRQAVALLIMTAVAAIFLTAGSAQAGAAFDGPAAAGATFGAALVEGIACWTVQLAVDGDLEEEEIADRGDDFDRPGWFLGQQGVFAREDIDVEEEEENLRESNAAFPIDFSLKDSNTAGTRTKLGRRCHSRFSVELEVEWLDDFEGKVEEENIGKVNDITFSPIVTSINTKGYFLTGRVQPFALFGIGTMFIRTESKNTTGDLGLSQDTGLLILRFGGGLDYYVTPNWVISGQADYVYSATNLQILNYTSIALGVQYRF